MDITIQELQEQGAKKTYNRLKNDRQPYIQRAVDCAKVTIPSLFPEENDDKSKNYDTPYQSVGARGINNLASKLILALMPPNSPFSVWACRMRFCLNTWHRDKKTQKLR